MSQQHIGYNSSFLNGYTIAMPKPNSQLVNEILFDSDLRDDCILDYENYSVIMNAAEEKRSAAVVAFMFDQNLFKKTKRARRWNLDSRIDFDDQLDNDYYRHNVWDRGHLARRSTAGWGQTTTQAQRSANDTFFYTNAALQHENLNQDEWLSLEEAARDWDMDDDGKILSFNGCIYGDCDRSLQPEGRSIVRIPCAFFKVLAYVNLNKELECRAFIVQQDSFSLKNKSASKSTSFDAMTYQVSLMEIEQLTGLIFDSQLYDANPLKYNQPDDADSLNITTTPERIEIFHPDFVIGKNDKRQKVRDDEIDIFITLLNIKATPELIVMNMGTNDYDLSGWQVFTPGGQHFMAPNITLGMGDTAKITLDGYKPLDFETLILCDNAQDRIDWVQFDAGKLGSRDVVAFVTPTTLSE